MNNIHWFPGHMTKALRMMEENIKLVDMIIYVLDARAPVSCLNPSLGSLIGNKPVVYVLNKSDLVLPSDVEKHIEYFRNLGGECIALNSTAAKATTVFAALAKRLCGAKLEKMRAKGVRATVRAMVVGVPNSGKSTLINNLCGKVKAVTGDKAGVTRGKQWVKINDYFEVLDTPGTLYPKLTDQAVARKLAYIGSIKTEVLDTVELAQAFLEEVSVEHKELIETRFKVKITDISQIMSDIARARGYIFKGGEVDIDRAASTVLDDFRKGRLGKICLDNVK